MGLLHVSVVCIYTSILLHYGLCDDHMTESPSIKLVCTCAPAKFSESTYFSASNCSASCNCTSGNNSVNGGAGWTCICASMALSTISKIQEGNCFTSCNCTSDYSPASGKAKKLHASTALFIVLFCAVFVTIAISAMLAYYFYHKDRFSVRSIVVSSGNSTSWNSGTNLLSQQSGRIPAYQVDKNNHVERFYGFLTWVPCFFKRNLRLPGSVLQFSYFELEHATNKFSKHNLLGIGGSSKVYLGNLRDGRLIAVKRLNMLLGSHSNHEFLSEIEMMSRLHHCHIVPLLGYCSELRGKHVERLLVFEYLPKGNLRDCLDASCGQQILEWKTRVSIAIGAARGLEYLHEAAAPRILHRDIKSTNILLDDKFKPKITDLGMAKRLMTDDLSSCASSPARMMGTFGYFAPEYAIVGRASLKSDVFSFGVVLLELITGRKPIHKSSNKSDESLVLWATPRLHDSKLVISDLPDPLLKGNFPEEEMQIIAYLAKECLQWDPESRPTMSEVVQILCTISADKAKKRNFSIHVFSTSRYSEKNGSDAGRHEVSNCLTERVEIDRIDSLSRREVRYSLGKGVGEDLHNNFPGNSNAVVSSEYMDKLAKVTMHPQGSQASEDEAVDLTEPRFESFMLKPCIESP